MAILNIFLLVIFVISCSFLILLIVIQNQDDGGLGSAFGPNVGKIGGSSGNILTRATGIFGFLFFFIAGVMSFIHKNNVSDDLIKAGKDANGIEVNKWWEQNPNQQTPQNKDEGTQALSPQSSQEINTDDNNTNDKDLVKQETQSEDNVDLQNTLTSEEDKSLKDETNGQSQDSLPQN